MKKFAFALPILAAALLVLVCGRQAFGSDIVYNNDTAGQGNQNWTGNLALTFTVNPGSSVIVGELGVFNASGSGSLSAYNGSATNITVGIYDATGTLVPGTQYTFSSSGSYTLVGYDLFQAITPVTLTAGSYAIDAIGFNGPNANGNISMLTYSSTTQSDSGPPETGSSLDTDNGAITPIGAAWDTNTTPDDPTPTVDNPTGCGHCGSYVNGVYEDSAGPNPNEFAAGTFEITPEPGSLLLLGTGLLGLAAILFRKARPAGVGRNL